MFIGGYIYLLLQWVLCCSLCFVLMFWTLKSTLEMLESPESANIDIVVVVASKWLTCWCAMVALDSCLSLVICLDLTPTSSTCKVFIHLQRNVKYSKYPVCGWYSKPDSAGGSSISLLSWQHLVDVLTDEIRTMTWSVLWLYLLDGRNMVERSLTPE